MIGVEKFFNDREYVLGIDGYVSFFLHHGCLNYEFRYEFRTAILQGLFQYHGICQIDSGIIMYPALELLLGFCAACPEEQSDGWVAPLYVREFYSTVIEHPHKI